MGGPKRPSPNPDPVCHLEEHVMLTVRKQVGIYVDRASGQWVVRDPEGGFWTLPPTDTPWDDRRPFSPTGETELEPVPGHYRYMLRLPRA
jgi:hypothetical protein